MIGIYQCSSDIRVGFVGGATGQLKRGQGLPSRFPMTIVCDISSIPQYQLRFARSFAHTTTGYLKPAQYFWNSIPKIVIFVNWPLHRKPFDRRVYVQLGQSRSCCQFSAQASIWGVDKAGGSFRFIFEAERHQAAQPELLAF